MEWQLKSLTHRARQLTRLAKEAAWRAYIRNMNERYIYKCTKGARAFQSSYIHAKGGNFAQVKERRTRDCAGCFCFLSRWERRLWLQLRWRLFSVRALAGLGSPWNSVYKGQRAKIASTLPLTSFYACMILFWRSARLFRGLCCLRMLLSREIISACLEWMNL